MLEIEKVRDQEKDDNQDLIDTFHETLIDIYINDWRFDTPQGLGEEEETRLGEIISESREARKILDKAKELSEDKKKELKQKILVAKEAKDKLVKSNLALVVYVAKRYQGLGLDFNDLIQEGNMGLIKAAERFNPDKGCRFSTYAYFWILQGILRALDNQSRIIRLPNHILRELRAFEKKSVENGLSEDEIDQEIFKRIKLYQGFFQGPVSLDKVIIFSNGEEGDLIQEGISSDVSVEEEVEKNLLMQRLLTLIDIVLDKVEFNERDKQLDERNKQIVKMYFLSDGISREKIGRKFGISRERVRQIINKAIVNLEIVLKSHPGLEKEIKQILRDL